MKKFIQNIFSIKNNNIYKIIIILGIKIKFKSKRLLKKYNIDKNSFLEDIFSVKNNDIRKVITILSVKLKIKSQSLIQKKLLNDVKNLNALCFEQKKEIIKLKYQITSQSLLNKTDLISKNSNARILVILHLFYMDLWDTIRNYLDNLNYYNYDLIITCINGFYDDNTLNKIKLYKPNAKFYFYENIGYDIGPFIDTLNKINLDNYDIVYKLHSKGINREYIYIYNQIFKKEDWFENLFEGILGLSSTHKTVDEIINNDKISFVAADNLIVKDPKHKQQFVIDIAKNLNIEVKPNYDFVAGSCWATSAKNLKVLQKLNLTIDNFESTKRGEFSFAHAMERISNILLTNKNKKPFGISVYYNKYQEELLEREKYNSLRLLDDDSFKIDYEFFYKCLEGRPIYDYKVMSIPIGKIKRFWKDKKYSLYDCSPFKYLNGEIETYKNYCKLNKELSGFDMSKNRFDNLIQSFEQNTFDWQYLPVINENGTIMDGQHRCCYLLKKYGKNYKIGVLCLSTNKI